ncbi:MAG: metallophosphoesterase family protein [Planctomycetota bacterium]
MKLLALADIHGYTKQIPLLADAVKDCDAVVLAGDITDFGGSEQACVVLSALSTFGKPVLGVPGNCDSPQVDNVLKQHGGSLVHGPIEMNGAVFVGFPYAASAEAALQNEPILPTKTMVLVTHQPAWGTTVDLQASTRHKGSRSVRSFIEDYQPILAVSGHIHEACGTDQIGSTLLVNPGPFRNGCYAIIDINGKTAQAKLHCL